MDDTSRKMMVTIGATLAKNGLMALGSIAATHGVINSNQTETFVAIGMAAVGGLWSLWNSYGRVIVLSQLEMLKAKSLAQAAAMRENGIRPVTTIDIANQSPTLTPADVAKTVATLPAAIQANIGKLLLAAFLLGALAWPGDARAQGKPLQITGNPIADAKANLGIAKATVTGNSSPLGNILGALDDALLPDLVYAKKLADASGSKVTAPCYGAWIDMIQKRKTAVTNDDGTPMDLPSPRLITDFEKAVALRNALQPDSDFMRMCAPVANMIKQDMISFIGKVLAGGAGLASLVPGL